MKRQRKINNKSVNIYNELGMKNYAVVNYSGKLHGGNTAPRVT